MDLPAGSAAGRLYCTPRCRDKAKRDRLGSHPSTRVNRCSAPGCARQVVGRSICETHRGRMRFGIANVECGFPWCDRSASHPEGVCGRHLPLPTADVVRWCSRCHNTWLAEHGRAHACPDTQRYIAPHSVAGISCVVCGCSLYGRRWTHRTNPVCSPACRRKLPHVRDAARCQRSRRRARQHQQMVERISPRRVFERDGWRCGICHHPINRHVAVPSPMAATVDHIVPLARGGPHSYANVQAAHFMCNSRKGAREARIAV